MKNKTILIFNSLKANYAIFIVIPTICFFISGCFFSSSSVHILDLPNEKSSFVKVSSSPKMYKRAKDQKLSSDLYLTSLEKCNNLKKESLISKTRKLFIGLNDLKINKQENFIIDQTQSLKTFASAEIEGKNLNLIVYSIEKKCTLDYIIWYFNNNELSNNEVKELEKDLIKIIS